MATAAKRMALNYLFYGIFLMVLVGLSVFLPLEVLLGPLSKSIILSDPLQSALPGLSYQYHSLLNSSQQLADRFAVFSVVASVALIVATVDQLRIPVRPDPKKDTPPPPAAFFPFVIVLLIGIGAGAFYAVFFIGSGVETPRRVIRGTGPWTSEFAFLYLFTGYVGISVMTGASILIFKRFVAQYLTKA
jgi:hypothetical protein